MAGVAVNVTEEPAHDGLEPDVSAMLTDGVKVAFTVIAMPLDVASAGLAHAAFEVISQVTICPLVNVVVVKVELFVPAFDPFIFH